VFSLIQLICKLSALIFNTNTISISNWIEFEPFICFVSLNFNRSDETYIQVLLYVSLEFDDSQVSFVLNRMKFLES
jgi:hypothetical protein